MQRTNSSGNVKASKAPITSPVKSPAPQSAAAALPLVSEPSEWLVTTHCYCAPPPAALAGPDGDSVLSLTLEGGAALINTGEQPPNPLRFCQVLDPKGTLPVVAGDPRNRGSLKDLSVAMVNDLLRGYNCSVLCHAQPLSPDDAPQLCFSPTAAFFYGSSSDGGLLPMLGALLFEAVAAGAGPGTEASEAAKTLAGPSSSARPPSTAVAKWNWSVEVTFAEFFEEEFTDLLLVPPNANVASALVQSAGNGFRAKADGRSPVRASSAVKGSSQSEAPSSDASPLKPEASSFFGPGETASDDSGSNAEKHKKGEGKQQGPVTLKLRTGPNGPFLDGAKSIMVSSFSEFMALISGAVAKRGDPNRKTNPFSHTVLRITLRQTAISTDHCLTATLSLVDVSAHERLSGAPPRGEPGSPTGNTARQAFLRARRAISSSLAFKRVLQQVNPQGAARLAASAPPSAVALHSMCKESPFTAFISDSFSGNVRTRFACAIFSPRKPRDSASDEPAPILQAALNTLRSIGSRAGPSAPPGMKLIVKPNITQVAVAATAIQSEVARLKRELKEAGEDGSSELRKEELRAQLEAQQDLLTQFTQRVLRAEESQRNLRMLCEKQQAALNAVTAELNRKAEIHHEKEQLAAQVDEFLQEQSAMKSKLNQEMKQVEQVERQLSEMNYDLRKAQSLRKRKEDDAKQAVVDAQQDKQKVIANMLLHIVESYRVKAETETLQKRLKQLKAQKGVLSSKATILQKKIDELTDAITRATDACSAIDTRMELMCNDRSSAIAEQGIEQLTDVIRLIGAAKTQNVAAIAQSDQAIADLKRQIAERPESDRVKAARALGVDLAAMRLQRSDLIKTVSQLEQQFNDAEDATKVEEAKVNEINRQVAELVEQGRVTDEAIELLGPMCEDLLSEMQALEAASQATDDELALLGKEKAALYAVFQHLDRLHDNLCGVAAEKLLPV